MNENALSYLKVAMENYPMKVLISKERRAKYFGPKDKIPQKYQGKEFDFRPRPTAKGVWLYNKALGEFVVKNPMVAGKERYQVISGNEMFARTHERIRDKVVKELKNYFRDQILKSLKERVEVGERFDRSFENPVHIEMEIHTPFGVANWDVDNLWIYHKCFYDALVDAKVINNDNIIHVRKGGGTEFIPIREGETPRMVFILKEFVPKTDSTIVTLQEDPSLSPGEIQLHKDYSSFGAEPKTTILMGVGKKKIIYGAAQKAIRRAMYYCLNNFHRARVKRETFKKFEKFFECFPEHRVEIIQIP